jgi:hypothetical protein
VAIFGTSNFHISNPVAGGDTVSAFAAGAPSEFHRPTYKLSRVGDAAVYAASIADSHLVEVEEEIRYETNYGND